ncbi:MAG TPA: redoxin domain-containing protein, partial [Gemmataceae bacterium]|nr:redoxin domain-containing protein [Gemmataceae bacterium]
MLTRLLHGIRAITDRLLRSPTFGTIAVASLAAGLVYLCSHIEPPAAKAATALVQQPQQNKSIDAIELFGGTDWLNTDAPIKLADLRGRIVLLDFWTLCCINCIHTLPDLATLEARYPGVLVVIGVHTPKFDNEKKTASIQKAINRYEIKHPVINDADRKIWNA